MMFVFVYKFAAHALSPFLVFNETSFVSVLFAKVNKGDAALGVELDIVEATLSVSNSVDLINRLMKNNTDPYIKDVKKRAATARENMESFCATHGLIDKYHSAKEGTDAEATERQKRSAAGLAAIGTVIVSVYTLTHLSDLRQDIKKAASERTYIAEALNAVSGKLEDLEATVKETNKRIEFVADRVKSNEIRSTAYDILGAMETTVAFYSDVLRSLDQGRFSRRLLTIEEFNKAYEKLALQASKKDLAIDLAVGDEYQDAMASPASVFQDNGILVAILHLPLTSLGVHMNLYRFSGLPVRAEDGWFGVSTSKKYLAVSEGHSNSFYSLTEEELAVCKLNRGEYRCPDRTPVSFSGNIPRGKNEERCIHSLYLLATNHKDDGSSLRYCKFGQQSVYDEVRLLSPDKFAFFMDTSSGSRLNIDCHSINFHESYEPAHMYIVDLPPGCKAKTADVRVDSREVINTRTSATTHVVPSLANLGELLKDATAWKVAEDSVSFDKVDDEEREKKIQHLRGEISNIGKLPKSFDIQTHVNTAVIVVVAVAAVALVVHWIMKKKKKNLTANYNSQTGKVYLSA